MHSSRGLPDPEIEPTSLMSPTLAGGCLTPAPPGSCRTSNQFLLVGEDQEPWSITGAEVHSHIGCSQKEKKEPSFLNDSLRICTVFGDSLWT